MLFNNDVYDELMQVYYNNQRNNRDEEDRRKNEIYEKIPRIAEIDNQIAMSSIEAARAKLKGSADTIENVRENNRKLIEEKKSLLTENGYAKDYLDPIYTCPLCQDTGKVDGDYCSCFKQATISMLYKQSTLEKILQVENFDTFELEYYSKEKLNDYKYTPYENMSNILAKTKQFVEDFDKPEDYPHSDSEKKYRNFLLYGDTGLGKTFLSNCIAKALMDKRHTVLYQSSIHLFEEVCGNIIMKKNNDPRLREIYDYLFSCDLLIIDDLGTEYTNSFVSSELYNILNTRMREKKSTVISTNLNLSEINDRYSDRISTRIFAEYKVFHFYGSNVRLAKRRNTGVK